MLHGGGGTAKAAAWETEWTAEAEKEGFIVVFPNALARDPTKASSFAGSICRKVVLSLVNVLNVSVDGCDLVGGEQV